MVVCHCKGICDREVRRAIRAGANHRSAVTRACGAGSVCGGCHATIEEIVEGEAQDEPMVRAFQGAPAR